MPLHRMASVLAQIGRATGGVSCALLFLLLIADIVLRQAEITFRWATEYSTFLMAFIVFFPLASVTRRREHLLADFLVMSIGGRVESAIRRWLAPGATLLFTAAILALAFDQAWTSWLDEERSTGPLRTPMWLPQSGMVVALAAMLFCSVVEFVRPRAPEGRRSEARK